MNSNRFLAPSISLHNVHPGQDGGSTDQERWPADHQISLQVPCSPASRSLGGETLRSRADSFNSTAETEVNTRSRANSDITTIRSRFEGDELTTEEALRPSTNNEEDFEVLDNPFAFSPGQLNKLTNPKSLAVYRALGGLRGLETGLQTDITAGLSIDETLVAKNVSLDQATLVSRLEKILEKGPIVAQSRVTDDKVRGQYHDRMRVFKDNRLPAKNSPSIWRLFWNAFNDRVLIILTIAALVSLALGIYEAVGEAPKPGQGAPVDWIEGLAIAVAVVVVVLVTGLNDYKREGQFQILNAKKEDRQVKSLRSGKSGLASVFDVMVGDVLHLESGDLIPSDGILIEGYGIKCDESSITGESHVIRKTGGDEVWARLQEGTATSKLDPFIISGSKVLEGVGKYLVTSVGVNSSNGKLILVSLQTEDDETPLQVKLTRMANRIGYLGTGAAGLLFVVLLVRFLAGLPSNNESPALKGSAFLDILIVAITIIVVAVPEGLPVAVTLALSFATKRMLTENNLVRHLRACETMGNATTICTDKTGTLTQNRMKVVAGTLGSNLPFISHADAETIGLAAAFERLSPAVKCLLLQSCAINSTAFEGEEDGRSTFIGSKTETAILTMAKEQLGMSSVAEERAGADIVQLIPFDSDRKCMGVVIRLASGNYRLLVKGAAELLLEKVSFELLDLSKNSLQQCGLSDASRAEVAASIDKAAAERQLRMIALVYKDFPDWHHLDLQSSEEDPKTPVFQELFQEMTLLAVLGIQDPLRGGVCDAVKQCQMAGVSVKMITGDSVTTASAIATQCGIKTEDGLVMEGPSFRQLTNEQMDEILPRLQVLARSSPHDKRVLVSRLKYLGETVAVTGDGTNDGPALKTSDVGFSMGLAGTEVAKEASDIVLMDDNFSSIIKAIMWGRSVNASVAKFLQFQITVNITAVVLAFVSAVSSPDMHSVLSAVQLLWVNLIMDSLAALALATDSPTEAILDQKPAPKHAALITANMWKMIVGQSIYQLVVTFVLYFAGSSIFGYSKTDTILQTELNTIVFNTFVWMQILNQLNCRRLDNRLNIFEGAHRNPFFIIISIILVAGQITIVLVGGAAFQVRRIDIKQFFICILCALPCLLWAVILRRCIPDEYAANGIEYAGRLWLSLKRPVGIAFKSFSTAVSSPVKGLWRRTAEKPMPSKFDEEEATISMGQVTKPPTPNNPSTPTDLIAPPIIVTSS